MRTPPGSAPLRHLPRWLTGVLLLSLAVGVGVLVRTGYFKATPPPERTAAELVKRDGTLWDIAANQPFSGWLVERQTNGSLRSRSWLVKGVLNEVSEGWYANGTLQIREHFVAGLSDGNVTRWREDGAKLSEATMRAGKMEGQFRRWHPNGQLAEEVAMSAGEPDGISRAWFPDGSLKAEVLLEKGKMITQKFWKEGEHAGNQLALAPAKSP